MIFAHTVRYKTPHNIFFRRIRRAHKIETVTLGSGAQVYRVTRIATRDHKAAVSYIPVEGTVVECGRHVLHAHV